MSKAHISVDHVARVEGHGNIHVEIEAGSVKTVEMNVVEPARLFEAMVRGRNFADVPYISSRICGICSASHVVTDLLAIEAIFGVEVSARTHALRELLIYGSYLQNHASHLFVFAAPDYLNMPSVFPLAEANKELFDKALKLKALGNKLCNAVGGRSIHPICAVVGGFTAEPSTQEFLELAQSLEAALPFVREVVDLFAGFEVPEIETEGNMLAMVEAGKYPVCTSGQAKFLQSENAFDASSALKQIEEYEVDHSAALFAREKASGKPYFTGALARINASWTNLSKEAKFASAKANLRPLKLNPFLNNVAQAVELVDVCVRCAQICKELANPKGKLAMSSKPVQFDVCAGSATGFTEAPRGVLFHNLELDSKGCVKHATILTPTAQNCANLEADMRLLAENLVAAGAGEAQIRLEIEKLVRAYDPCFSCSVH